MKMEDSLSFLAEDKGIFSSPKFFACRSPITILCQIVMGSTVQEASFLARIILRAVNEIPMTKSYY